MRRRPAPAVFGAPSAPTWRLGRDMKNANEKGSVVLWAASVFAKRPQEFHHGSSILSLGGNETVRALGLSFWRIGRRFPPRGDFPVWVREKTVRLTEVKPHPFEGS